MLRVAKWLGWNIHNGEEALFRLVPFDKYGGIRSFSLACPDRISLNLLSDDVAAGQRRPPTTQEKK